MVAKFMSADERYPVYTLTESPYCNEAVEVTDEQVDRWTRAQGEFEKAQDEMGEIYEAAARLSRERREREKARLARLAAAEKARLKAAQQAREKEQREREDAAWSKLSEQGGRVYDADGNVIGTLGRTNVNTGKLTPPAAT